MRLFVFGISGQIQVAAKDEDAAAAVAGEYGEHLKVAVAEATEANENDTVVACGISIASKPKAVLAVNPIAARRLGAQRDLFRDALLDAKKPKEEKASRSRRKAKGPRATGDATTATTPQ